MNLFVYWKLIADNDDFSEKKEVFGWDIIDFSNHNETIIDEDIIENFFEELLNSSLDENISFSKCVYDNYGKIYTFQIITYEEFSNKIKNKYLKFEKRTSLFIKTPFFFDDLNKTLLNEFKKQYSLINLLTLNNISLKQCKKEVGYILSFDSFYNFQFLYRNELIKTNLLLNYSEDFNLNNKDDIFERKDLKDLKDLNGKTCILEGDYYFTEKCNNIKKIFKDNNKHLIGISDLYNNKTKLKEIIGIDNLIIETTKFNDKLNNLIDFFKSINYLPKRVFFLNKTIFLENDLIKNIEIYKIDNKNNIEEINLF